MGFWAQYTTLRKEEEIVGSIGALGLDLGDLAQTRLLEEPSGVLKSL
jgi:hypothetical protein